MVLFPLLLSVISIPILRELTKIFGLGRYSSMAAFLSSWFFVLVLIRAVILDTAIDFFRHGSNALDSFT